jgi:hypothetical protein
LTFNPLKWNQDNFDFYYEGYNSEKFSEFNSEIYNKKFKDLIDNDKILCQNFEVLKKQWDWLVQNRVTFQELINKELEIIYNEIEKAEDVFKFFEWYSKKVGLCYINIIDKSLIDIQNVHDTIIILQNLNGEIIGILGPDGTIQEYQPGLCEQEGIDCSVVTIPTTDQQINDLPEDVDFCEDKEIVLEEKEYDFC